MLLIPGFVSTEFLRAKSSAQARRISCRSPRAMPLNIQRNVDNSERLRRDLFQSQLELLVEGLDCEIALRVGVGSLGCVMKDWGCFDFHKSESACVPAP
jgi:hypothetical protein